MKSDAEEIQGQLRLPAYGLIGTAVLGLVFQCVSCIASVVAAANGRDLEEAVESIIEYKEHALSFYLTCPSLACSTPLGVVMAFGAIRMLSLRSHGLAMVSCILAMVPCLSPCCVLGLPVGIWAAVVLNRAEVKAAFE